MISQNYFLFLFPWLNGDPWNYNLEVGDSTTCSWSGQSRSRCFVVYFVFPLRKSENHLLKLGISNFQGLGKF